MFPIVLSWQQLAHEKVRFLVAAGAVSFAVILMFMQFGFQTALFESASELHQSLDGDLFIVHKKSSALSSMKQFSRRSLYRTLANSQVESVTPLYVGFTSTNRESASKDAPLRRIMVIGMEPDAQNAIKSRDEILFDCLSRRELGVPKTLNVGGAHLHVNGTFSLGTSFAADGNIKCSSETFRHIFPQRGAGAIDIGMIKIKPKANLAATKAAIHQTLPTDLQLFTKVEFISFEQSYWRETTAIGFIFSVGVALSLVVGGAVVYQILYASVNEHLSEYATLKAIGFSQGSLVELVLEQAVIISVFGFFPGLAIASWLYNTTRTTTGLPMEMSTGSMIFVLALITVMCCCSALMAADRLRRADPASVFN